MISQDIPPLPDSYLIGIWFLVGSVLIPLNKFSSLERPVVESAKDPDFILFRNLLHLDDTREGILGLLICKFRIIKSKLIYDLIYCMLITYP